VAGATGYTGRSVVRALREQGVQTVAHVRPDSAALGAWRARFEALGARVDTTPWRSEVMRATLASLHPSLVFALLGTTRTRGRRLARERGTVETYETVDYGLTMLLYDAARGCDSRPRFVYLSALGVRQGTRNAYLAARALVERTLTDGDLPYLIARPSFITGPDRDEFRPGERISARISDLLLGVAGMLGARRLRERYRSTTPTVLARALVLAALDAGAANRVLESEELR
jgi:uncharacterized protein YbjT (DUF2867 family)